MIIIFDLILQAAEKTLVSFSHNWPYLLLSVLIAVGLKIYLDPQKVSAFLLRYRRVGVWGATAAAVTTPFCSCGTTAVVLGMIASTVPWAPIVAFMVSSPLSSPEGLVYSAGLFGWPFAIALFVSSILLGLWGGLLAELLEKRGWLANQARFGSETSFAAPACACKPAAVNAAVLEPRSVSPKMAVYDTIHPAAACCGATTPTWAAPTAPRSGCDCGAAVSLEVPVISRPACGCGSAAPVEAIAVPAPAVTCGCGSPAAAPTGLTKPETPAAPLTTGQRIRQRAQEWARESFDTAKKLLPMFLGFAFIGYFINGLIPQNWIISFFGQNSTLGVVLASSLGIPFYINSEGSLPLVRAFIDGGMSQGAALAFLITGSGTSIGAVTGMLTIARWRVVALVVGTLWVGAILLGTLFNLLLAMGLW